MKAGKLFIPFFVIVILIIACQQKTAPVINSRTEFPPAPKSSVQPVVENNSEVIAAGKVIFETKCNRCHELKGAQEFTTDRWTVILKSMIPKSRLNSEQAGQVTSYVMANAKK